MFLIETQSNETHDEPFKTVFDMFESMGLPVPPPLTLVSASPGLFVAYSGFLKHYGNHPELSPSLLTAIRYHVARREGFQACIDFNGLFLEKLGMSADIEPLAEEHPVSTLSEQEQQILSFVSDALFRPKRVDRARLSRMTQSGISESALLDGVVHGAFLIMMGAVVAAFSE